MERYANGDPGAAAMEERRRQGLGLGIQRRAGGRMGEEAKRNKRGEEQVTMKSRQVTMIANDIAAMVAMGERKTTILIDIDGFSRTKELMVIRSVLGLPAGGSGYLEPRDKTLWWAFNINQDKQMFFAH
uniref:Uncharacterized protein n=1 Tax=Oryza punctata TaxID=4537 RepID=A0A0E0K3H6_ORYPU